jgi:hypothetical protein
VSSNNLTLRPLRDRPLRFKLKLSSTTSKENFFSTIISIIFLLICTYDIFLFPLPKSSLYWNFLANIIFLNSIHIAFTFMMIASLPELKTWLRLENRNRHIVLNGIVLFAALWLGQWWLRNPQGFGIFSILLKIFWIFLPFYHIVRQTYGISSLYSERLIDISPADTKMRLKHLKKIERSIFDIFLYLSFIAITCIAISDENKQKSVMLDYAIYLISGVFVILVIYLLKLNSTKDLPAQPGKILFLLRLLLYPFAFLTPLGFIGLASVHGIEYASIFRKMSINSRGSILNYLKAPALLFFVPIFLLCLVSNRSGVLGLVSDGNLIEPNLSKIFSTTVGALSFVHYYFDGLIFKFKNSSSRGLISPLLS